MKNYRWWIEQTKRPIFFFIQVENKYSFRTEPTNDQIKKNLYAHFSLRVGWRVFRKILIFKAKNLGEFLLQFLDVRHQRSDKRRCREKSGF